MVKKDLQKDFKAIEIRFKTFKAEHVDEIRESFEKLVENGLLDNDLYDKYFTGFNYEVNKVLGNAKSIIIIAAPQGKSIAEFELDGRIIETVIPPTYIYQGIRDQITTILDKHLTKNGYQYVKAELPLKLLAVKSGLSQYGRNNICYVPDMGSFVRLDAFITDYEFDEDSWGDMTTMESCQNCTACIAACPAKVITKDRFLIHAKQCITNFNEHADPIPEVISPDWHNAVVGCMKCQAVCPQNRKYVDQIDKRVHFNERETELFLSGSTYDNLPLETRNKISSINMEEYYEILPRNISLLLN